jgi:hypothetical protein
VGYLRTTIVSGTGSPPVTLTAPALDLIAASDTGSSSVDNITADTTPDLDIVFPDGAFAGDIVKVYDGGTLIGSHTITTGEALAAAFTVTLAELATGVHPLTVTLTRGASVSSASAILSVTIDPGAVAPVSYSWWRLSIPGSVGSTGVTMATLEFRNAGVNQATGGTGFVSDNFSGHAASLAFDADGVTAWWSLFDNVFPKIIGYHFVSPVSTVDSIGIETDNDVATGASGFLLQYSTDSTTGLDGTWTTKNTITGLTGASHSLTAVINFPTP